ncbi:MAG: outer membrane protein assembly factor BamB [Rhodothermales bacterium]|jgi:outer membrane protein assembly factor BamB
MKVRTHIFGILLISISALAGPNWPQWRGPTGDGVSSAVKLPETWSENEGLRWKCALPEWGNSTPAVWGDAIFLTAHLDGKTLQLLRIDKSTGQLVWSRTVGEGQAVVETRPGGGRGSARFHKDHNLASPSPVTDGEIVAVHFGNGDLATYDFAGKELWKRNLVADHGPYTTWWGRANSPVLHKDLVISVCMQDSCEDILETPSPSYVVAHHRLSGKQAWKTMRTTGAKRVAGDSYITPVFRQVDYQVEMIVAGGGWLDAYAPETGERRWYIPGLSGYELARNPVLADGMIFMGQARRSALTALRPKGEGELGVDAIVWRFGYAAWNAPSPVIWKGKIYMADNNGIINCIDMHSGKKLWRARLRGNYRSSPIAADDRIYFLSTDGLCTILAAGDRFDKLAENTLDSETYASPAIAGDCILVRGRKWLYCIGPKPIP